MLDLTSSNRLEADWFADLALSFSLSLAGSVPISFPYCFANKVSKEEKKSHQSVIKLEIVHSFSK